MSSSSSGWAGHGKGRLDAPCKRAGTTVCAVEGQDIGCV